jgi:hypothetical protein
MGRLILEVSQIYECRNWETEHYTLYIIPLQCRLNMELDLQSVFGLHVT